MSDRRRGVYALVLGSVLLIGGLYFIILTFIYQWSTFNPTELLLLVGGILVFVGSIFLLFGIKTLREQPEIYRL